MSEGVCAGCGQVFPKDGMGRHVAACQGLKKSTSGRPPITVFHLEVQSDFEEFWLHLGVPGDATLGDLDEFLRTIWLECCGHLSAFQIGRESICSATDAGRPNREFRTRLGQHLRPGLEFRHDYDFGTTTTCYLKVVGAEERVPLEQGIALLARNEMPELVCGECGKPAEWVCVECMWEGEGWLCEEHAGEHPCGEEMLLPVVNSPRMGQCGYGGPDGADPYELKPGVSRY